jgi:hypothetical protein
MAPYDANSGKDDVAVAIPDLTKALR